VSKRTSRATDLPRAQPPARFLWYTDEVTDLILGPVLRHVGERDATVWVETSGPTTVEVLGHREPTWTVSGHHYALVHVTDLPPASTTTYDVRLDDTLVWPLPDDRRPAPTIRTLDPDRALRLIFGSCRFATPTALGPASPEPDALDAYARRMMAQPTTEWPDALLLLGDQVYADETSPAVAERIREHRDVDEPPGQEVRDFEEYTWLYHESWSDPEVRWILSTVPSSMIFDDHDVRDDWNTSAAWRRDMQATSWWQERIIGGLGSYWVYQHLGNLSPRDLETDELYQRVRQHDGDAKDLVRAFAVAADAEADGGKGARWSYRRDLGRTRLLVIDSRCGRILEQSPRSMISEAEFGWISEQVSGDYDHLLVGTSLPWLLPRALHDLESWNERLASGVRGRLVARWAEWLRRRADLEHWAAFRASFDALADLLASVGRGERAGTSGTAPATICVLSGDVHHAYVAKAELGGTVQSKIYQLTCSPLHNHVPPAMQFVFRVTWNRATERAVRAILDALAKVPPIGLEWEPLKGPYFGNQIGTLQLRGRHAEVSLEQAGIEDDVPSLTGKQAQLTLS
jgi:hypothetical protein